MRFSPQITSFYFYLASSRLSLISYKTPQNSSFHLGNNVFREKPTGFGHKPQKEMTKKCVYENLQRKLGASYPLPCFVHPWKSNRFGKIHSIILISFIRKIISLKWQFALSYSFKPTLMTSQRLFLDFRINLSQLFPSKSIFSQF